MFALLQEILTSLPPTSLDILVTRGLTVAVDAMSWLHKGVFACDVKALAKQQRSEDNKPTQVELKCIKYTTGRAEILQKEFGMSIILVIDGDALPSKKEENAIRREEREKNFQKALAAEQAKDSRAARRFYASSCSVTHKMRYMLIKACKELGINFIVAPYEADAQMARLAHTNVVDLVITEDSDMLVYGCPRVCFKIDWNTLQGQEIQLMKDLGSCVNPSFRNFTHDMFVFLCIVSGCDYCCKGVPGIGIKLAHKLVRIHRTPSKIFSALRAAGRMPLDFEEQFFIAFRTFRHQRVFCPEKQQIETLYPIAGSNHRTDPNEVWPFLGEYIESSIASKIADGSYHPSLKIPWSEALKQQQQQQQPTHQSSVVNDLQIHHRSTSTNVVANGGGRNRRGASNKEKTNVWHTLIYGSKDNSQSSRHRQQESQPPHDGKENNASSKRDMFSFFPQNKRQGSKDDTVEQQSQPPPVPEIYVGNDDASTSLSKSKSKSNYVPPAHHRDIPIHFNEYASRLVGRAFKPISRKRKKQELDGTKSSKYVQKIWEKCAKIQRPVLMQNQAPIEEVTTAEKEEVTQGVSRFKRDEVECHDASQDTYFHATNHDSTYQDVEGDAITTTHYHQQYDVLPDCSVQQQLDVNDEPYQNVYQQSCDDQVYEERSVRSSHDFSSTNIWHQEFGGRSDTTSYEENRYHTEATSSYSHHHEDFPQSYEDEPRSVAFKDDHDNIIEEEHNLFAELQSIHDDTAADQHEEYSSNMTHGSNTRYDYHANHCDDIEHITDDFSQHNPFNQLQTVMKKKPAATDSSRQGNYMDDGGHAEHNNIFYEDDGNVYNDKAFDGRYCTDADYDDAPEDNNFNYNPFAQLKTVKKPQVSFRSY